MSRWTWWVLAPPFVFLALASLVFAWASIEPPQRLSSEARRSITKTLRSSLFEAEVAALDAPDLLRELPHSGPVIVGVWQRGTEVLRVVDCHFPCDAAFLVLVIRYGHCELVETGT